MLECTFQLAPGIGPARERQLWAAGVTRWDAFPAPPAVALSPQLDGRLRPLLAAAREALALGDAGALAAMLPERERWRLYRSFEPDAAFLDIEVSGAEPSTSGDGGPGGSPAKPANCAEVAAGGVVTAIGVLDRNGPRVFLRGRDLELFPEAASGWKVLVTFNGIAFDVPILRRAFPSWTPPCAHVDLRHLWARLGHRGGLKALEAATGVGRPDHLAGVDGMEAVRLWSRSRAGDREALRLLAEYNLYDAVNLKALMTIGYNRMIERYHLPGAPVPPCQRGDVLYDISRQLLAV